MMEQIVSQKVVCSGGLNSNVNHIQLSDNEPGSAIELLNFETSLYGGYRRLTGFAKYNASAVDPTNAEGRILVVAIMGTVVIAARKQKSGNTYAFYFSTGTSWTKYTTPTRSSLGVQRIRWATFNFNGTEKIIFVDGVNPAIIFDGVSTWTEIKSTNTGATIASAGGDQAIDRPKYVEIFKNHIFLAQDNLVAHSAPLSDYDWKVASGAGQLPVGFAVNQIKMFRDAMYIFGINNIKYVAVAGEDFVVNEVTANIGCLAPDSVQEIAGNLVFLSQDGIRPISGTDRIGDVELESISRKIQLRLIEEIAVSDLENAVSLIIRGKSQYRLIFGTPVKEAPDTRGIIGCLKNDQNGVGWEWGGLKGIRASCAASRYVGAKEIILHGDYDGFVYQQEAGNTFAGLPITAVYSTPYLDFGDAGIRKTMRKIRLFVRPEGQLIINTRLTYDWEDPDKINPDAYIIEKDNPGSVSIFGEARYSQATYSSLPIPVLLTNVQGSGNSVQMTYYTSDTNPPYTIQGALYEFKVEGKK